MAPIHQNWYWHFCIRLPLAIKLRALKHSATKKNHKPGKDVKLKNRDVVVACQIYGRFECHCFKWRPYVMHFRQYLPKLFPRYHGPCKHSHNNSHYNSNIPEESKQNINLDFLHFTPKNDNKFAQH